jgi:WD40 repeat protein
MTAPLERRHDFWARAACISPDQQQAALMHNGIALIDLENLQVQKNTTTWDKVVRSASFVPDSEEIIAGKYNGEVVRLSGAYLQSRSPLAARHTGWVEGMAVLRKHPVLITAGAEGTILFSRLSRDEVFGKLGKKGEQITSLHISPDEQFMAVGYADATIGLWDLRALDLPKLFQQPFDSASPGQLAALRALAESDGMPEAARGALQFSVLVLQYRFRYDIEVDAAVEIKPGEFDIEIADA